MAREDAKKHPAMVLRISGLSEGEHPFEFETPAAEIGLTSFEGNVTVTGNLSKVGTQLFMTSEASGRLSKECDRCLGETRLEISVPINIYYQAAVANPDYEGDEDGVEVRTLHPEDDTIVLDDEVRQSLLLGVPLKVLCSEDCRGICPSCGADLNKGDCNCQTQEIDPRWAKLSEIFKKPEEE
jgi:uncharacterized protein